MKAETRTIWKRSLFGVTGAGLVVFGGIAAIRGEVQFFGRASGALASYSGHTAVAYGLPLLAIGVILLAQLTRRSYRNLVSVFGGLLFLLALAVQLSWIFAS